MAKQPRQTNSDVADVFDMMGGLSQGSNENSMEISNEVSKEEIIEESKEEMNEKSKETITEDSNEKLIRGSNDKMIESSKETKNNGKAKGRKGRSKTVTYDGVEYRSATFLLREDIHKALKHYGVDNGVPDYQTVNKALAKFLGIRY